MPKADAHELTQSRDELLNYAWIAADVPEEFRRLPTDQLLHGILCALLAAEMRRSELSAPAKAEEADAGE